MADPADTRGLKDFNGRPEKVARLLFLTTALFRYITINNPIEGELCERSARAILEEIMALNRRQFLVATSVAFVATIAITPAMAQNQDWLKPQPTPDFHKGIGKKFLSKWEQNGWPPR
jgi:hypothetical protein